MDTSEVVQAIVSGLVLGSIYALMTVGFTLVYGTLRTLNMAHGVMVMVGGFVAWVAFDKAGIDPWASLLLAFAFTFVLGMAVQRIAVQPLIGRVGVDLEMAGFIATLAVAIILQNLALLWYGPRNKAVPPLIGGDIQLMEGVEVTRHSIAMGIIAVTLLLVLGRFLSGSRHGLAIGAVAQDLAAARLMGVPTTRVYLLNMGLASGLAGIAGVLLASVYFVSPNSGDNPLLKALIVAIFGGLGSVRGTIVAAYTIGLLEAGISLWLGVSWSLPLLFLVIIAVLTVRPYGLYGRPQEARL
jgi:branched-subunit amino acid ABC-type transport system permease component